MKIADNCFIVTGGASGLGAGCVRRLAGAGGKVVFLDLNVELGKSLEGELGSFTKFVRADVTNDGEIRGAIETAVQAFGPLRGLVNCAGIEHAERVVGKSGAHALDMFAKVIQVNLIGTFNAIRLASESMSKNEPFAGGERGAIVNTASVAAYDGQIGQAAYSASKGGVVGMTLPLARDLARNGIRVVTIAPGVFDTPLMARFPDSVKQALEQLVPFPPRLGKTDEFAALAQHIFENEMLNGETIRLDGALRMPAK